MLPSALIAAPRESRRGGAVLCIGSCRDLPIKRSIIARRGIPARNPLWNAKNRSQRPPDRRSSDGSNPQTVSRRRYVYVGLSIASGYRYAPTTFRNDKPPAPRSGVVVSGRGLRDSAPALKCAGQHRCQRRSPRLSSCSSPVAGPPRWCETTTPRHKPPLFRSLAHHCSSVIMSAAKAAVVSIAVTTTTTTDRR